MRSRSFVSISLLALLIISVSPSTSQVKQVDIPKTRVIQLSRQNAGSAPFAVASTSSGDLLTLVGRDSGSWELHRIRNWDIPNSENETLSLPGFFSKDDRKNLESLGADIFVTGDDTYAICIGEAFWQKRKDGRPDGLPTTDDVISVVDLAKMQTVATMHTLPMKLLPFTSVWLAPDDKLALTSLSDDSPRRGELVRMNVPQLSTGARCAYNWVADKNSTQIPIVTTVEECNAAVGTSTLKNLLQTEPGASLSEYARVRKICEGIDAEFCRTPGKLTKDGKFGVSEGSEGHDNFFGSWVLTKRSYIVFSSSKRSDIGRIVEPPSIPVRSLLTERDGKNYFILLERGSQLNIYELHD